MSEEDIAVRKFREYLRINTEQPDPDYEACKDFLFGLTDELGIQRRAIYTSDKTMFVIMTIPGENPDLPSLALYSHTDVVATSKKSWKHDPYAAFKDEEGNIYGRGAQDMKLVGIQYFEAIRRHFLKEKKNWERTIHIIYGPEEENRGPFGMSMFVETKEFQELNIGFVLDEGIPSWNNQYFACYAERSPWLVKETFMENTAIEKMQSFIRNALPFRASEKKRKEASNLQMGEVSTLNITMLEGGVQPNVVPEKLSLTMDMRVSPLQDLKEIEGKVRQWCKDAGTGVTCEFLQKYMSKEATPHTKDDPWWAAFETALNEEISVHKNHHASCHYSRFMRAKGIRCIGFSPVTNTPLKVHAHNEFINEKVFLRGVEIYETVIDKLAGIKDFLKY